MVLGIERTKAAALGLAVAVTLAGCAGWPTEKGANPMDWGPGAATMSPGERAFMSSCTQYASWNSCKEQLLGPRL